MRTGCFFGGGTAISLLLGEFRESFDIDFLCADTDGYRSLREMAFDRKLSDLFGKDIEFLREIIADQYGIRTVLSVGGSRVKFEIVREARISLTGKDTDGISVPTLVKEDLFAEKLLANADRYADTLVKSRDIIDLIMMENHWGQIPTCAWEKTTTAYGKSTLTAYNSALLLLANDPRYFERCLEELSVSDDAADAIRARNS